MEGALPAPDLQHFTAETLKAGTDPSIPSHRIVLAALSGAALAGAALVVTIPTEAPATPA
jgi:hypothetical protein